MTSLTDRIAALSPEKRQLLALAQKERAAANAYRPFCLLSAEDRSRLPADLEDAYPLSLVQLGMVYEMGLTPDAATPAYHNVNGWLLKAPLDLAALREATARAVARHPILRTSFELNGFTEPLQLVHRHAEIPIAVIDLRQLPWDEQQRIFDSFVAAENRRLFDVTRPPMMRFHIHRRSEDSFQFTLSEPHSISDGWSTTTTLSEIFTTYFALLKGQDPPRKPPLAFTYGEFVRMERQVLASEEMRRFWDDKLAGLSPLRLPRWPLAPQRVDRSRRKPHLLVPPDVVAALGRLARGTAVPLKTVLLAAHLKVLSLASGQDDVVTGLVFNGRPESADGDQVRGLFLNTVPLRLRLEAGSWRELIRRTFEAETELLPFRRYPLPALQGRWGRQPLFESFFTYLHFHSLRGLLRSGDFKVVGSGHTDRSVTHYPVAAVFRLNPLLDSHLTLFVEFDDRELPAAQVAALQALYAEVLAAMAAGPDRRHDAVGLLAPSLRHQLLVEWNDLAVAGGGARTIHGLVEAQVERTPGAAAVRDGAIETDYRELDERANRLARFLRRSGVGPESRVGVCLERSLELVVAILGVLKAGGAYVPLDPAYPPKRLAFMAADSAATLLLTSEAAAGVLPATACPAVFLDREREAIGRERPDPPAVPVSPRNLAYVIYTSGSTGRPKGVAIEHRSTVALLDWVRGAFTPEELAGVLASTSICFDVSVFELFAPLTTGGRLILARNPFELPSLPAAAEVTLVSTAPSAMAGLLAADALPATVRTVNLGGEPVQSRLVERLHERGVARVLNLYGPSEDTTYSTEARLERGAARPPIGRPVAGKRVHLLDRALEPVPLGAPGEIYIGGVGLARGYLNRPELTAERFVPSPFQGEPGARLYRTGDLARFLLDGRIDCLGRLDHQVKIRGFRIELGEVEKALLRHPQVREAVVEPRPDPQGELRLVAFLVTGEEAAGVAALRAFLRETLPDYMVPSAFVALPALPLNPNGKVDRRALPAPEGMALGAQEAYRAPESELEKSIAGVWAELLGVERVGLADNFFDLGGHSLLLIQSQRRLAELGLTIPVTDLFRYTTVSSLAACLAGAPAERPAAGGEQRAELRRESRRRQSRAGDARRAARGGEARHE